MHMSKKCRMTPTEIAPLIPSSRNSDSVCVRTVEKVLARYEIFKDVKDIDKSVYRQVAVYCLPQSGENSLKRGLFVQTDTASRSSYHLIHEYTPVCTRLSFAGATAKVVPRKLSCKRGPADRAQYNRGGNALMVLKVRDDAL